MWTLTDNKILAQGYAKSGLRPVFTFFPIEIATQF